MAETTRQIYVSTQTGNKTAKGTKEDPYKFLWMVLSNLKDGDTIHVAEGLYFGQTKNGIMPKIEKKNISLIGGYTKDFSNRDPFKNLTQIGTDPKTQGPSDSVIKIGNSMNKCGNVTIDGFVIDRGEYGYYYGEGPPGAGKKIEGYKDCSAWGWGQLNRKMSGSAPTIEVITQDGSVTVKNCLLVNNTWWGIYVKVGGPAVIENNLIFISQGRGIEALGAWGTPNFSIKYNTIVFGNALKTTEGDSLSIDPRKGGATYDIQNNVLAFNDGAGVKTKFDAKEGIILNNNIFWFNRRADVNLGAGEGTALADDFDNALLFETKGNAHKLPDFLLKIEKNWFDRYSQNEYVDLIAGKFNTNEKLMQSREALGLAEYNLVGYTDTFPSYDKLPQSRPKFDMSRYPHEMKVGEKMNWTTAILPIIGADGDKGVQPFKK